MALVFGGASTDRVNIPAAASIDSLTTATYLSWVYPTSLAAETRIICKGLNGTFRGRQLSLRTSGALDLYLTRGTTDASAEASTLLLTANAWWFVGFTYDAAATPSVKLYIGSLTSPAAEPSYASQNSGSGTTSDDSAMDLRIGNQWDNPNGWKVFTGRIATCQVLNRVASLAEIASLQYQPRVVSGSVVFQHLGWNGTSTQPDWSGNGNVGTVTGATVGDHVPLGPTFGWDTPESYIVTAPAFLAAWAKGSNILMGSRSA